MFADVAPIVLTNNFQNIPKNMLILDEDQCRYIWMEFETECSTQLSQAIQLQDAARASSSKLPPIWMIIGMIVLGWNEFTMVIRRLFNPFYLVFFAMLGYLVFVMWQRKALKNHFSNGLFAGMISLALEAPEVWRMTLSLSSFGLYYWSIA